MSTVTARSVGAALRAITASDRVLDDGTAVARFAVDEVVPRWVARPGSVEQLAGVMSILNRASAERAGRPFDDEADRSMRDAVRDHVEAESLALFNTGQLYDDGIIDPRDTRTVLGIALSACHSGEVKGTDGYGVFRM